MRWRNSIIVRERVTGGHAVAGYAEPGSDVRTSSLPALDAHGFDGVQEINRTELVKLTSKFRLLSPDEEANLDRGCPGFACLYQGLGITRWPESARGTLAHLNLGDALKRHCLDDQENFVFLKQGWWLGGSPPSPDPITGPDFP
jgi:hypothetical protein